MITIFARCSKLFSKISILLFALSVAPSFSQSTTSTAKIQGRVFNQVSHMPLSKVNVTLVGTPRGAATDSNGYYRIEQLTPGVYHLQASMIGFKTQNIREIVLADGEVRAFDIFLAPTILQGDSVVVEAERLWEKYQTNVSLIGTQKITAREIVQLPGAFDDPIRAVLVRSGSAGAGDFNSFLATRGSSPEQNLVVLDGAIIPNPYRFRLAWGGGLSIFDPLVTQNVQLSLGGYSAEFGNALSSVLEVETRPGSLTHFKGSGALNLTDAGAMIEGPIWRRKASFLLSARRTYLDLLAQRLAKSNSVYPYFQDFTTKWFWQLNSRNKITLSLAMSREQADLPSELSKTVSLTEEAKNRLAIFSWKSFPNKRAQLETVLSYHRDVLAFRSYNPLVEGEASDYENLDSKTDRVAFGQSYRWHMEEQSWLNAGWYGAWIDGRLDFRSLERNFYFARNEFPQDIRFGKSHRYYAAHLESVSELSRTLQLRLGVRFDHSTLIQESALSPRFNLLYHWDGKTTLEGSWGVFYQYPDPLTVSIRDQPLDIGSRVNVISAEKSTHLVFSIKRKFSGSLSGSLSVYNMDIDRLLLPEDRITFKPFNDGQGISRGLEFMLEALPSTSYHGGGLLSYAFGISQYRNRRSHEWIPFNYDRRHTITFWYSHTLGKHWSVNVLWRYASGLPYTAVIGARIPQNPDLQFDWDFIRGRRNEKRLPAYQRLDARLSYQLQSASRKLSLYLDFINLYNYRNVYNLTWEKIAGTEAGSSLNIARSRTIYMLPLLPSLGLQFVL